MHVVAGEKWGSACGQLTLFMNGTTRQGLKDKEMIRDVDRAGGVIERGPNRRTGGRMVGQDSSLGGDMLRSWSTTDF